MSETVHSFETFLTFGLSEQKARETMRNAVLSRTLLEMLSDIRDLASLHTLDRRKGLLLYSCASRLRSQTFEFRSLLVRYIMEEKVDNEYRLSLALDYFLKHPTPPVNFAELERVCGVGVYVSEEEVCEAAQSVIARFECSKPSLGVALAETRKLQPWADGKLLKRIVERELSRVKDENTTRGSSAKQTSTEEQMTVTQTTQRVYTTAVDVMRKASFHRPGENYTSDDYVITSSTMELLKDHLKRTGGQVRTRFPPEPNGILHIGHAKAININFAYALAHDGICFLRYDDTNPEKEEEEFFHGIQEMVDWLGYKPYKITYSSDYFDELYRLAKQLIISGHAYVCHQKVEEMRGTADTVTVSPWRDRPSHESIALFEAMRRGQFEEGAATLRLRTTLEEGKQDPVAYRIKYVAHVRTGTRWCIYPTYDYTHCLCDSLEDITHSLCTKEFQSRRSSYYWLCNALNLYCPVQWEYGRLNVLRTLVSKRKLARLIDSGVVSDWDDPRLFTLTALRRRGFPPQAINKFSASLGLTGAQMCVDPEMLEAVVRDELNWTAPRRMLVQEPLRVRITNLPADRVGTVEVPDFPNSPQSPTHSVHLDNVIFIERDDFRTDCSSGDYRRLTGSQSVGLRHAGLVITVQEVVRSADTVQEVRVICAPVSQCAAKPRAFIHWVSERAALGCEVRLYSHLFTHKNPCDAELVPDGFLSDVRSDSLVIHQGYVDKSFDGRVYQVFQFERLGYFAIDRDSCGRRFVFNRTVSLREDSNR